MSEAAVNATKIMMPGCEGIGSWLCAKDHEPERNGQNDRHDYQIFFKPRLYVKLFVIPCPRSHTKSFGIELLMH